MVRTVISLEDEEKAWLDEKARETGQPMTAIVRAAIARYRSQDRRRGVPALSDLLARTRGIWKRGDGLAYQRRIRSEWKTR